MKDHEKLSLLCLLLIDIHLDPSKNYVIRALEASAIADNFNLYLHNARIKDFLLSHFRGVKIMNIFNVPFENGGFLNPPFEMVRQLNGTSTEFMVKCMKYLNSPYAYFEDFLVKETPRVARCALK